MSRMTWDGKSKSPPVGLTNLESLSFTSPLGVCNLKTFPLTPRTWQALMGPSPSAQVWVCEDGHACANGTSTFFCFAYDEVRGVPR